MKVKCGKEMWMELLSESVFMELCWTMGTSQQVALRRDSGEVIQVWIDVACKRKKISTCGSSKEGFSFQGSDVDLMIWQNHHRVIWELSQSQYYNIHRKILILCDSSESPPGYTLLQLLELGRSKITLNKFSCFSMKGGIYISSSGKSTLGEENIHGPCLRFTAGEKECDLVYSFVSDFWPPSASSWIDRCHSWPQPHVVDDIVKNGCHFVPIGHKLGRYENHEWRISFSLAEQKLVYSMNHCQFLTYGLLKLLLKDVINKGLSEEDKLLSSYNMKTAVFWVAQQNTILDWCPQNLLECFWVCFKLILKWVYEGVCPNFFIPQNNMFLSKIHGEAQHSLFQRLYRMYEKGLGFLLSGLSIKSYLKNVHIPATSFFIDEQNLIPEMELDKELFSCSAEHLAVLDFHKLDLNLCIIYLQSIKKMIRPQFTQCKIVLLQKLTSFFFQSTAFLSHNVFFNSRVNKMAYPTAKISCHLLKLAARFGCISDMLYIALYYYRTCQFKNALLVIQITKDKLSQLFVLYRDFIDRDEYMDAVGGQSWPTKMRSAVAMDILLVNKIHYISELIPEQQYGIKKIIIKKYILTVPPFVLLYMLEILCYRYTDTMRVQTVLNDLQNLVHDDKGFYVPLHLRDISWQILGICQQVTGNLQAALHSYQQSLRQEQYNEIQMATIMRIASIIYRILKV